MTGPASVPGFLSSGTTVPLTNQTTTYFADISDCVINCTSGTFTVTLPTATGISGQYFFVKNSGTGVITVDAYATETIDGFPNKILAVQNEAIMVISDGANWIVV